LICCGVPLRIVKTIHLGGRGKTKTGKCVVCGRKFTIVEMVVNEVKKHGDGAMALAAKMRESGDAETT
jgi:hypothetical protein